MQQVAASNNDIAANKLFVGDVSPEVSGAGSEFAKIMIGGADKGASDANFRGYSDVKSESGQSTKVTESGAEDRAESGFVLQKQTTEDGEQGAGGHGEQQGDELHDEWVSIIQKLNGNSELEQQNTEKLNEENKLNKFEVMPNGIKPEAETDEPVPEEGSDSKVILFPDNPSGVIEQDNSDNVSKSVTEVEHEVVDPFINEQVVVATETENWRQQLKDKLLNSGQPLDMHQMKSMDKTIRSLSDEEIKQLLNDDQALKQMMSEILKVEEPDPQDVALMMLLAEQNNQPGGQNTVSLEELAGELQPGSESGNTAEDSGDNQQSPTPEVLLNQTLVTEVEGEVRTDIETAPIPEPQPEPETSLQGIDNIAETVAVAPSENVSSIENVSSTENVSSNTVSDKESVKPELPNLNQLLSEVGNISETTEGKIAALDNLTRRIESSDVGQTEAGKKFLASLKNVTEEFKDQLKAGHEPGINISKVVAEAMQAEAGSVEGVALDKQLRASLQQMVNVAQAQTGLDAQTRESMLTSFNNNLAARESNTAQIEAQKTQQHTLHNQAFDKAVNIQKPEAAQELANKVQVMMNQKNMVADIRLDPPELGQMQIKISMQGDSASVSMVVQSQAAREVLEQNQPRLKELLEQQGIELGQSSVHEEQQGQKGEGDGQNFASGKGQEAMDDLEAESSEDISSVSVNKPEGIDYFA